MTRSCAWGTTAHAAVNIGVVGVVLVAAAIIVEPADPTTTTALATRPSRRRLVAARENQIISECSHSRVSDRGQSFSR
jgi:hypothetical protein